MCQMGKFNTNTSIVFKEGSWLVVVITGYWMPIGVLCQALNMAMVTLSDFLRGMPIAIKYWGSILLELVSELNKVTMHA